MPARQGLGRFLQPHDAADHDRGDGAAVADRADLHHVGLPGAPRAIDGGRHHQRPARLILNGGAEDMWHFSGVLALGQACAFAAPNAMWLELSHGDELPDR